MDEQLQEAITKLENDIHVVKLGASVETLKAITCFEQLLKLFNDNKKQNDKLENKVEELEDENGNLEYENHDLSDEINSLECEIQELKDSIVHVPANNLPTTYVYEKVYALLLKYGPYKLEDKLNKL